MSFDLNIDNYSKKELEDIFQLPSGYNEATLIENEKKLTDNILSDSGVDKFVKMQTLNFISDAKKNILSVKESVLSVNTIKPPGAELPNPEYYATHPSDYFPGTMNAVIKRNRTINLNIDTRFRDNYYVTQASNFHFNLPLQINSVVNMQVAAIEFPPTAFFNISKLVGNNFFWLRAGTVETGDLEETVVTIPDGNYVDTDAVILINAFLQSLTTTTYLQYIYFAVNENASSTSGSSHLIVAVNTSYPYATPFDFIIDLQANIKGIPDFSTPLPLKLGWLYGFRNGIYTNNSAYLSEGVVNLSGSRYLYLVIDDYNNANNTFFSAFNASLLNKNILARISVQSSRGDAITQSNIIVVSPQREYYGPVDIEKMQIQLLDEYGRLLNLNNMDFSFCLTFTTGTAKDNQLSPI